MDNMKISLVQADLDWEDPKSNRERVNRLLDDSGKPGDIIILSEMFTTGFTMEPGNVSEKMDGESVNWMIELAGQYDALVLGSLVIEEKGDYFNRMVAAAPGGVIGTSDKRHLFRMAGEEEVFSQGQDRVIVEWKGWRILPLICYDLRFPMWSRNRRSGSEEPFYDLLVYVANWPVTRISHWDLLLQARAIENQCFVAGVNRVGEDENGFSYSGSSAIVDAKGYCLAKLMDREGVLQADLDADGMLAYRNGRNLAIKFLNR